MEFRVGDDVHRGLGPEAKWGPYPVVELFAHGPDPAHLNPRVTQHLEVGTDGVLDGSQRAQIHQPAFSLPLGIHHHRDDVPSQLLTGG